MLEHMIGSLICVKGCLNGKRRLEDASVDDGSDDGLRSTTSQRRRLPKEAIPAGSQDSDQSSLSQVSRSYINK
jgi:hypothetical protein